MSVMGGKRTFSLLWAAAQLEQRNGTTAHLVGERPSGCCGLCGCIAGSLWGRRSIEFCPSGLRAARFAASARARLRCPQRARSAEDWEVSSADGDWSCRGRVDARLHLNGRRQGCSGGQLLWRGRRCVLDHSAFRQPERAPHSLNARNGSKADASGSENPRR